VSEHLEYQRVVSGGSGGGGWWRGSKEVSKAFYNLKNTIARPVYDTPKKSA